MNQRRRVVVALIYAGALALLSRAVFGAWVPPIGPEGAWFYSGLAILLISVALQEPFFTTPAHCIGNAFALLLATLTFPEQVDAASAASISDVAAGRLAIIWFAVVMIVVGLVAVFTKDAKGSLGRTTSAAASKICATAGSARVVFSVAYLTSVFAVYSRDAYLTWPLLLGWLIIVVIRPLERLPDDLIGGLGRREASVAEVVSVRHPGLVDVRIAAANELPAGTTLHDSRGTRLVTLDSTGGMTGGWALLGALEAAIPSVGSLLFIGESDTKSDGEIGPIEPGSTVDTVLLRAPVNTPDIREGALVELSIRGVKTIYQVLGATIKREAVDSGLQLRSIEIAARKVGSWDGEHRKFVTVPWLPAAGEVAHLVPRRNESFHIDSVGSLPDSEFAISLNPDHLVTHNTAILGILGVGKTYLTFELVRRLLTAGTKVIVLDITGEYAEHFRELFPAATEDGMYDAVDQATGPFHGAVSQNVHEGGSIGQFTAAVSQTLRDFLNSERALLVVNPERFAVTRQDSRPFQGQASMAPLTMVEVTRVIAEQVLVLLQALPMTQKGRVCLVLEEAHSLVPEWNSTSYSVDQQASTGVAKAVLQGRKYGLGVVLITQRTANVTKTILNQCHTIFAMRTFDATGMEFLRNYIGDSYVNALASLEERHVVVFGRASSCPNPVIIRVNNHEQMLQGFWEANKDGLQIESLGIP